MIVTQASPSGAQSLDVYKGVNETHLGWKPPEEREKIIDDMRQGGVGSVRVDLMEPFDKYIDSLDLLTRKGLSILLIVPFAEPYMVARDATRRPGRGSIFSVAPLSQLDPEYFRESLAAFGTKSSGVASASRRSKPGMKLTGQPSMAISGFYRRRDNRRKARRVRLRCMIATPICAGFAATPRQWPSSNSFATPASTIVTLKSSPQASH